MRYKFLRHGCWPALGAVLFLVHPPAMGGTLLLRSALCGSGATVAIPVERVPRRSHDDDGPCAAGCHIGCAGRKRQSIAEEA